MAGFCQTLAERDSLAGNAVIPASLNGTSNTGLVDMSRFNRVMFICATGTVNSNSATVLQQGNNANGSDQTNITNAAAANVNGANATWTLEVASNQLTGRYVRCQIVNTLASIGAVIPVATMARYAPANAYDSAQVAQRFVSSP